MPKAKPTYGDIGTTLGDFSAEYLGSVPVKKPTGNEVCADAVVRVKELAQPKRKVQIVVTVTGVYIIDAKTMEHVKDAPIRDVSFVSLDTKDKKLFSYITNNRALKLIFCHIFKVPKRAQDIPVALNQAFRIASGQEAAPSEGVTRKLSKKEALAVANDQRRSSVASPTGSAAGSTGGSASNSPTLTRRMSSSSLEEKKDNSLGAFEAKYLGNIAVTELKGVEVVEKAVKDLLAKGLATELVILMVTAEGLRTIEGLTGNVMETIFIKNISFTTVATASKNHFAFISKDSNIGLITCHVYQCAGETAFDICEAIGKGFKIAHEEQKNKKNPFLAAGESREKSPESLAKLQVRRGTLSPIKILGAGQFGEVYLAWMCPPSVAPQLVAVKMLRSGASSEDKTEFVREAESMVQLQHTNLCCMLGVSIQQRPWLCVLEFCKFGDLKNVVSALKYRKVEISMREMCNVGEQIAAGMAFMAGLNLIHMDLAARNVLVHENSFKVADFGLTRAVDAGTGVYQLKQSAKLPMKWMAIEAMDERVFSEFSDVWAFGVTLWELASYGELPYGSIKNADIQVKVRSGVRLERPANCSESFFNVVASCWAVKPQDRPRFKALQETFRTMGASLASEPLRDLGSMAVAGTMDAIPPPPKPAPEELNLPLPSGQDWYVGDKSKAEVDAIVLASEHSDFLVRRVASDKFAIIINDGETVVTYPIKASAEGYGFGKANYPTIEEVVVMLRKSSLKGTSGRPLVLTKAAKGGAQKQAASSSSDHWYVPHLPTDQITKAVQEAATGDFFLAPGEHAHAFVLYVNDSGKVAKYNVEYNFQSMIAIAGSSKTYKDMAALFADARRNGLTGNQSGVTVFLGKCPAGGAAFEPPLLPRPKTDADE